MILLHNRFKGLSRNVRAAARAAGQSVHLCRYAPGQRYDWQAHRFMYYPPTGQVAGAPPEYDRMRRYFYKHKAAQRQILADYFDVPTPHTECAPPWVVRPVRHHGGKGFRVAESEAELRRAVSEYDQDWYASALFRRTHEFRAFFVGGKHTTTMLKKVREGRWPDPQNDAMQKRAWNASLPGSDTRYLTITRAVNDKLRSTSFYRDAEAFLTEHPFDAISIDAAYNDHDQSYAVFETNFAPLLTVESSLVPFAEALAALR